MSYSSPFFRPGLSEIMSSLLKKRFLEIHLVFLFLSYSFGIETYNASIHSRSSLLKPYPSSRKKWVKSISVFRPKRHKNHSLWGGTYPCGWDKAVPAPGYSVQRRRRRSQKPRTHRRWLCFCHLREFSITKVIVIGSIIRPNKILETQNWAKNAIIKRTDMCFNN